MNRALLAATSVLTLCLASGAMAQETINLWVRTGIGTAFTSLAGAYNASHENQIALTEVPFSELVQKYAPPPSRAARLLTPCRSTSSTRLPSPPPDSSRT